MLVAKTIYSIIIYIYFTQLKFDLYEIPIYVIQR